MQMTTLRLPSLWHKAMHSHAAAVGSNYSVEVRRALADYFKKEGIDPYKV